MKFFSKNKWLQVIAVGFVSIALFVAVYVWFLMHFWGAFGPKFYGNCEDWFSSITIECGSLKGYDVDTDTKEKFLKRLKEEGYSKQAAIDAVERNMQKIQGQLEINRLKDDKDIVTKSLIFSQEEALEHLKKLLSYLNDLEDV